MKRTLGFALLFTAAYLLIFSSPLKKEPVFRPAWVQDLTKPTQVAPGSKAQTVGFKIGDVFGYTTSDGAIKYLDTDQFNVAMADDYFINYSSVSTNLVEKDSSGRIVLTVNTRGYPLFKGGRFFIINTDRTALSELDQQGTTLWSRDFGSLITSMDANVDEVVVGLLDGSVDVVGKDGKVSFRYTPSGSKIPIVYGCAISPDGGHIAVVSGLDPQRFTLLGKDKATFRPRRVVDLGSDVRREVFLRFFPNLPYVYVELPGQIAYFSTEGASSGRVPVQGRIEGMSAGSGLIYAVSEANAGGVAANRASKMAQLTVLSPPDRVVSRSSFMPGPLFLRSVQGAILLGTNRRLMLINQDLR